MMRKTQPTFPMAPADRDLEWDEIPVYDAGPDMGPEYDAGVADGKADRDPRPCPEWNDDQTLLYEVGHGFGEMVREITDPDGPWAAARVEVAR